MVENNLLINNKSSNCAAPQADNVAGEKKIEQKRKNKRNRNTSAIGQSRQRCYRQK